MVAPLRAKRGGGSLDAVEAARQDACDGGFSGAALATLMASGEVPLSPTMFDSNVFVVKRSGAPVEWRPIDPVVANVGYSGIVVAASLIVERSGPFIGSMIAALPTAGGAAFIILAMEHPPAFVAQFEKYFTLTGGEFFPFGPRNIF